jgi:hypothetical protein
LQYKNATKAKTKNAKHQKQKMQNTKTKKIKIKYYYNNEKCNHRIQRQQLFFAKFRKL